jgi:hypothetical protein
LIYEEKFRFEFSKRVLTFIYRYVIVKDVPSNGNVGESSSGRTPGSGPGSRGSNPLSPANKVAPSSRGLGHRPLTAATGVQIPLGLPFQSKTMI